MQIKKNHDHGLIQPAIELFAIHEIFQLQEHRPPSPHNLEMNPELKIDTEPQRSFPDARGNFPLVLVAAALTSHKKLINAQKLRDEQR